MSLRRDADAGVLDPKHHAVAGEMRRSILTAAARRRELHRVRDEVERDLAEEPRDRRTTGGALSSPSYSISTRPSIRLVLAHAQGRIHDLVEVGRLLGELELARLRLRQIENVVDDGEQMLAGVVDVAGVFDVLSASRAAPSSAA